MSADPVKLRPFAAWFAGRLIERGCECPPEEASAMTEFSASVALSGDRLARWLLPEAIDHAMRPGGLLR